MSETKKILPELRFPEFKNKGEWEKDMVDNLVSTITPPKKITSSNYQKYGKFPIIDQSKNYYCGWTNDNEAVITEDLPLIIFGDHTCVIKIAKKPFAQGADGIKILKTKDKIFPEYLFHYLCHNEVVMEDYKRHYSILKDKVIVFPNINSGEQQKIASCLSSLDEVIEAHSKKLELLKDHKKGLMQNLFPQDGEKVPKLRFKEFENSEEWETKKIEDVLDYERPEDYIVSDIGYQEVGIPVLTANKSFILGYTQEDFGIYKKLPAIIFDDFTVDTKYVDFPFKVKSSAIKILTPKKKDNLKFIYELLSQIKFDAKEHKRYYISEYQKTEILFPTIQEQQKIASCLSSLDELIAAQEEKIEQLKLHKKGLMQGLFPKISD